MACSRVSTCVAVLPCLLALACGDTGSESGSASASTTAATNPTSSATATPTSDASSSGVPTTSGASWNFSLLKM